MNGHHLPYVFVLDWDGTIAGKVDFQSQVYSLKQLLKKHGLKPMGHAASEKIPKAFTPANQLVRPGFASFMKALHKFYAGHPVHFFIYTASEKQWALQEIAWVEKAFGIQFARPIFTREDCHVDGGGNYRKSLAKIYPRICRTISRNRALSRQEKDYILENQLIIIDNNAVYSDRSDKMLLCPDYDYCVFENLWDMIPPSSFQTPEIHQFVYSLINMGLLCPQPTDPDPMQKLTIQYSWLASKCKNIMDANKTFQNDSFWKYLRRMIIENQLRRYTPNVIRQLQEAVWKNVKKKASS